jgi:hypothetical protein
VSFGYRRKQRTCVDCSQKILKGAAPAGTSSPPQQASVHAEPEAAPTSSSPSPNVRESTGTALVSRPLPAEGEEWPSFDLADKLAAVYDMSCTAPLSSPLESSLANVLLPYGKPGQAMDVGVEALALAKGEASEHALVASESTVLWGTPPQTNKPPNGVCSRTHRAA